MNRILHLLIGTIALVGFILSLVVHISSLLGLDVAAYFYGVWFLHLGIFAVCVPLAIYTRMDSQPSLGQVATALPRWVVTVGVVICVYAVANFIIFIAGTEGGSPTIRDGKYLLLEHGKLIREITASEYTAFQVNALRGFSGHWLVFYFAPTIYFLFLSKSNNSFKPTAGV
jgi:hypothetical protein